MADVLDALREFSFGDGTPLTITVEKPLSAHGQRLADSLGVRVEVRPMSVIDVQAATESRDCLQPGCPFEAENGRTHCSRHRLLGELVVLESRRLDRPVSHHVDGLELLEQMDRGERIARPAPTEGETMPEVVCKIDGCDRDASDAPKSGPTAKLCSTHRAERSARISESRTGKPRGAKGSTIAASSPAKEVLSAPAANGSLVSKAERLLAAARAVDEIEAEIAGYEERLAQARDELKDAAAALA